MPIYDQGMSFYKSEEEHKLEIEELGLRFQYGCYMDKLPESCHSLGVWLRNYKEDLTKSIETFQWNCSQYKHGESCMKVALALFYGEGMDKDEKRAFDLFKTNCLENNHAKSCYAAGMMKFQNDEPDMKDALHLFEKGCDMDFPKACFQAGFINIEDRGELKQNYEKAAKLWTKSCDLGDPEACLNLAVMYKRGHYFEKDLNKFRELADLSMKLKEQLPGGHVVSE